MGRNSGKRFKRKGKFVPPQVPKSEELQPYQSYGVITRNNGGARRNMDITLYDCTTETLKEIKCQLKGSLRHFKCRQKVLVGSYVLVDYEDVVIIIFTDQQQSSIPENIFSRLSQVSRKQLSHDDGADASADFLDDDMFPPSESESDDDDDIQFTDECAPPTTQVGSVNGGLVDIDVI
jgi:hypothetical protein